MYFVYWNSSPVSVPCVCYYFLLMYMLKKSYRLTTKDVRYLLKKKNYFVYDIFWAYYVSQYPNRLYNQFSLTIGLNISKSAIMRHFIKRQILTYIAKEQLYCKSFSGKWYKCFIIIHKAHIPTIQKLVANSDRNAIQKLIHDACAVFFTRLYQRLWASSQK
jgi:ribonuclease P protein component